MASPPRVHGGIGSLARRLSTRLLVLDLLAAVPAMVAWLGLFEVRNLFGAALLGSLVYVARVLAWVLHLNHSLGRIEALLSGDEELSETRAALAAEQLRRLPFVHGLVYTLSWVGLVAVGGVVGLAGLHELFAVGRGDLLVVLLLLLGALVGVPVLAIPAAQTHTEPLRLELLDGLEQDRAPASSSASPLTRRLLAESWSMVLGPVFVLSAVAWRAELDGARQAAMYRAKAAALERARTLDEAEAEPESEPEDHERVVALDELPSALRTPLSAGESSATTLDLRREQARAAATLSVGRALVVEEPVELRRAGFWMVLISLFGAIGIGCAFSTLALADSIAGPIRRLREALRRVIERGDLGKMGNLPVPRDDDLGALTRDFNSLLDDLRALVEGARLFAEGRLDAELDSQGDLSEAFRAMVGQLHGVVFRIRDTARGVASAAAEIQAAARDQEAANEKQAASVRQISEVMESLARSANQISGAVKEVLDNAESTLATTDEIANSIEEFDARSKGIGRLLELIREIASRSDLLALNGALEATNAGEAGEGFALIAAEMRRLAERVTGTVGDVRDLVAAIAEGSTDTVDATILSRVLAEGTTKAAREIVDEAQRQSADTGRVSRGVRELVELVGQTRDATKQTRATADELTSRAEQLERLIERFALGDEDQSQVSEDES